MRASAPIRTEPSAAVSIAASGKALMSIRVPGRATSILIRSTMLVPPARKAAFGVWASAATAPSADWARA